MFFKIADSTGKKKKTYTTGGQVTGHPSPVSITVLLEGEHGLVGVTESEVEGLGWEVTDNVGSVTSPEGDHTLSTGSSAEAVHDAVVLAVETTRLQHLVLIGELAYLSHAKSLQRWFQACRLQLRLNKPGSG